MAEAEVENVNGTKTEETEENKNDVASEPTDLEREIVQQVEYYFGDMNLPRDKFMLEQIKLDNGWIAMDTMLKFQRLKKLSDDAKVIAAALTHSHLMEVQEDDDTVKIRRSPEFPLPEMNEERRKELQTRTVYIKGFPLDSEMDNIINFLKEYGPMETIIMRKYKDKITKSYKFKGSVFVTFPSVEKAEEFLKIESIKNGEKELIKKFESVYQEEKKKEYEEEKLNRRRKKDGNKVEVEIPEESLPTGSVLHLKGDFKDVTREDIRAKFAELQCDVAYISFNKGEKEAFVRFQEENVAVKAIEKIGKEIEIEGCTLETRLVEGEEEVLFLKTAKADREAHFKRCQKAKQQSGRRGGNRGGGKPYAKNKGGRKRKGGFNDEDEDDGPTKAKVDATDE